ncbi:MAG: TlyA family RNA methyltransferase [Patescibacteria group bacterium]
MKKLRLDVLLRKKGTARSRNRAKRLIKQGKVIVNGDVITKPSTKVDKDIKISITEPLQYASRAGHKLEKALREFRVNPEGLIVLDVGTSTGGFVDCLLQNGAKKIYAVDVGKEQLLEHLRKNPKIVSMEQTDIRDVRELPEKVELATVDVSFISLTKVLPKVQELIKNRGDIVALIKPQFEVGPEYVGKGGLVKAEHQEKALEKIQSWTKQHPKLEVRNITESPLEGSKGGNREFLIHLRKI